MLKCKTNNIHFNLDHETDLSLSYLVLFGELLFFCSVLHFFTNIMIDEEKRQSIVMKELLVQSQYFKIEI